MTISQQTLYILMQEHGYSHGLCETAIHFLGQSKEAIDDTIIYIEDCNPSEQELIEYIAKLCSNK